MEKKLYVPKATKFTQREGGSKLLISDVKMNCLFCNKELTDNQKYEFLRGKTKGLCSRKCGQLNHKYKSYNNFLQQTKRTCIVCNTIFYYPPYRKQNICSSKCNGKISSLRMKNKNPMNDINTRLKVSETLKKMNHKPLIQGGNGRGATLEQLKLYNEIIKNDNSFTMEYILKTGVNNIKKYNCPTHYKIDIASAIHKIAIEVDGSSHKSIKVKECDKKKEMILSLSGWKILRFTNYQIKKELMNCAQTVMSMI